MTGPLLLALSSVAFLLAFRHWMMLVETRIESLESKVSTYRDALDDIACDYNLHEGAEGEPITPGHRRCVYTAIKALGEES